MIRQYEAKLGKNLTFSLEDSWAQDDIKKGNITSEVAGILKARLPNQC